MRALTTILVALSIISFSAWGRPSDGLSASAESSIVGSRVKNLILADQIMYVSAIDGQPTSRGRKGWRDPLPLSPGVHQLTMSFWQDEVNGAAEFELNVQEGRKYKVAFKAMVYPGTRDKHVQVWLEDGLSGEKLTNTVRLEVDIPNDRIIFLPVFY